VERETGERFFYSLTREARHAEDGGFPPLPAGPMMKRLARKTNQNVEDLREDMRWIARGGDKESEDNKSPRRRAATAGEPMPARWFDRLKDCRPSNRCESPFCGSCRARSLHRQADPKREAFRRAFDDRNVDTWLVSVGRRGFTHTRDGAMGFRAALSCLDAALRAVGVVGCFWVLEAKDKRHEGYTDVDCCEDADQDCPVCHGTGKLPVAHLHAHAVVVVPHGAFIDWSWLQSLNDTHQLDPSFGTIDVELGKRGKTSASAFGYVTSYLSKRDTFQAAYIRTMYGKGGRTAWSTGEMRNKVKQRQLTDYSTDDSHDIYPETVHFIEAKRQFLVEPIHVGEIRHELDAGKRSRPRTVYREMVRWLKDRGIQVSEGSGWVEDAERWEATRGWEGKGKAVVQAQMWKSAHTTPSTGKVSSEFKEISSSTDEFEDASAVPVDFDYLQRLGRESELGWSARKAYG